MKGSQSVRCPLLRLMALKTTLRPGRLGPEPLVLGSEWSMLVLWMGFTGMF